MLIDWQQHTKCSKAVANSATDATVTTKEANLLQRTDLNQPNSSCRGSTMKFNTQIEEVHINGPSNPVQQLRPYCWSPVSLPMFTM